MTVVHHRSATGPADTALLVRRFLADHRRNPVNLLVVVLVPVVFVVVAAGPMADAAKLLGGMGVSVQTATAGWAGSGIPGWRRHVLPDPVGGGHRSPGGAGRSARPAAGHRPVGHRAAASGTFLDKLILSVRAGSAWVV